MNARVTPLIGMHACVSTVFGGKNEWEKKERDRMCHERDLRASCVREEREREKEQERGKVKETIWQQQQKQQSLKREKK